MINKLEKDDNIVKDEDCTKTKAYSVLWKLRDEIHHKRATKRDLKTLPFPKANHKLFEKISEHNQC